MDISNQISVTRCKKQHAMDYSQGTKRNQWKAISQRPAYEMRAENLPFHWKPIKIRTLYRSK